MYIKSSLSGAEFSNLYDFSLSPQLYSEVGNRFYRPTSETDFNNLLISGYYFGKLSQNTPDGTTTANWIVEVQAFDNNPNYVYQRATRASDKRTFTRYREGYNSIGWRDWEIGATKSDLSAYATKAQLEATFINLSNKRYVKITANGENANYGIIFAVTSQGMLCVYNSNGNLITLLESAENKVKVSVSGLVTTIDCAASYIHGFVLRGGSLKNMPYETL